MGRKSWYARREMAQLPSKEPLMSVEPLKILAIDPGSKHLGYAYMIGTNVIMSGVVDMWGNDPRTYTTLRYWTRQQCGEGILLNSGVRLVPEYVMLESYFPARQYGATIIPELRGIIKCAAYSFNLTVVEVPPSTVKKCVTGNGRATKDEVRKSINSMYDLSIKSTDQADAIATGLAGLRRV